MSLELRIKKHYPAFDLDVALEAGSETIGFLGESGSGKSLTLRCVAGLEKPDEGRIVVNGTVFFDSVRRINLTPQQRKTAMLFQNYMLFPNLTVAANIAAGIPPSTPRGDVERMVTEQIERFGLKGFEKRYPVRLSGGQQQRVALARMLAANPGILMLDEPFSSLDSHLKGALEQDLLDLFERFEGTILYVSHDIDEAFRFSDRIAVISNGTLIDIDAPADLMARPSSLATLKVTGVKNISPARYHDDHTVEALAWNLRLAATAPVPRDVAWVGVRASYLEPVLTAPATPLCPQAPCSTTASASAKAHNEFRCEVVRVSDSRFERVVMLMPDGASERLQWKMDKRSSMLQEPALRLLEKGEHVTMRVPPEHLCLVTS
ncbi:MAG: ATP-binding cassette domain-containing protein [Coriobacteriales bacterium]|jgi:molybdate transport system ATP-binding protein|nr:ATP-binding cassette domain-containing protein [Coriobacteriales bacterium]